MSLVSDLLLAPWTNEQVDQLNRFQKLGAMHPFTCGGDNCRAVLRARNSGWYCLHCPYMQNWAHPFMADKAFLDQQENVLRSRLFRR